MALRDEIDRDFPYQVALSLDDKLIGVLDWLDERLGRWDMYVDLEDPLLFSRPGGCAGLHPLVRQDA